MIFNISSSGFASHIFYGKNTGIYGLYNSTGTQNNLGLYYKQNLAVTFDLQNDIVTQDSIAAQISINDAEQTGLSNVPQTSPVISASENTKVIKRASASNGIYDGEIVNGSFNGFGSFVWNDGDKYIGEWLDNLMHGQGTYIWSNGDRYTGDWEHGTITGYGTYIYKNGDKYIGQWENGEKIGKGIFIQANGNSFFGVWQNSYSSDVLESSILSLISTKPSLSKKDIIKNQVSVVLIVCYNRYNREIGTGSGFIVSNDGKVITNYHVIQRAVSAEVITYDEKSYKVSKVLDYDIDGDIALLQVENLNTIPPVILGDSDKVEIGDEVLAIGSPYGLQNTISDGIVSGRRKGDGYDLIQTTAALSPGSSGGALFNMNGEVIGITSSKIANGENLNFAIPINNIKPMLSKYVN